MEEEKRARKSITNIKNKGMNHKVFENLNYKGTFFSISCLQNQIKINEGLPAVKT